VRIPGTRRRPEAVETDAVARLPGGDLRYVLRRSSRARRLRVTIHPERGVVVTVPVDARGERLASERLVISFLAEREPWIRRHLGRHAATRDRLDGRPSLDDGRVILYRGEPHRVRVVAAEHGTRGSRVTRVGGDEEDELVVGRAPRDLRPTAVILEAWFRQRARAALEAAVAGHATALGVSPSRITIRDTTSRWGSCSRAGALSFSWRLVLATPDALDAVAAHEVCHLVVFGHGDGFWALMDRRAPGHRDARRWLKRHAPEIHAALD
jgi:predicted metal-dependent hydrolase